MADERVILDSVSHYVQDEKYALISRRHDSRSTLEPENLRRDGLSRSENWLSLVVMTFEYDDHLEDSVLLTKMNKLREKEISEYISLPQVRLLSFKWRVSSCLFFIASRRRRSIQWKVLRFEKSHRASLFSRQHFVHTFCHTYCLSQSRAEECFDLYHFIFVKWCCQRGKTERFQRWRLEDFLRERLQTHAEKDMLLHPRYESIWCLSWRKQRSAMQWVFLLLNVFERTSSRSSSTMSSESSCAILRRVIWAWLMYLRSFESSSKAWSSKRINHWWREWCVATSKIRELLYLLC